MGFRKDGGGTNRKRKEGSEPHVLAFSPRGTLLLIGSQSAGWVGLRTILHDVWHWRVIADVIDLDDAERLASEYQPKIVLLATGGREISSLASIDRLHDASPGSRVVVLTETDEEHSLLSHPSVAGYLLWNNVTAESFEAVLTAIEAGWWVGSPAVITAVVRRDDKNAHESVSRPDVTEREEAILVGRMAGKSEKVIAAEQNLGVRTVEAIVRSLKRKFSAESTGDLCAKARDRGFGG